MGQQEAAKNGSGFNGFNGMIGVLNKCRQACFSPRIVDMYETESKKKKGQGKKKRSVEDPEETEDEEEDCHFADNPRKIEIDDDSAPSCSTKTDYVIEYLTREENKGDKFIIFCKWHNVIKCLLQAFNKAGISADHYDGSMSRDARDAAIYNFKESSMRGLVIQIDAGKGPIGSFAA